ncbi:protein of unknown function [Georgfuchsia toluolica]|uniref:Uncharacterized protein n=1 Tax=Georgfuchsia toluolica TaxID=424218 RepID=A0A916J279_9PROT|nr:protein of unknown function [Georgfuchsia toluolica]
MDNRRLSSEEQTWKLARNLYKIRTNPQKGLSPRNPESARMPIFAAALARRGFALVSESVKKRWKARL